MNEPKLTETTCIDVEQIHLVRTMWDDGKQFTYKYYQSTGIWMMSTMTGGSWTEIVEENIVKQLNEMYQGE